MNRETENEPGRSLEPSLAGPLSDIANAFVRFEADGELFAIAMGDVREVMASVSATRIPRSPSFTVGLMNHGGRVYTIIDHSALVSERRASTRGQVILLNEPSRLVGIAVDRVVGIGALLIDGDLARIGGRAVEVVEVDSLMRQIDAAFESESMIASPKLGR